MDYSRHPDVTKDVAEKQPWRQYRDIHSLIKRPGWFISWIMLPVAVAAVYETEKQEFVDFLRNLNHKCFEYFWQGLVLFSNKPGLCSNHYDQYICTIVQAFLGQSTYTVVCSTKHGKKNQSKSIHRKFLYAILFQISSTFLGIFLRKIFVL